MTYINIGLSFHRSGDSASALLATIEEKRSLWSTLIFKKTLHAVLTVGLCLAIGISHTQNVS